MAVVVLVGGRLHLGELQPRWSALSVQVGEERAEPLRVAALFHRQGASTILLASPVASLERAAELPALLRELLLFEPVVALRRSGDAYRSWTRDEWQELYALRLERPPRPVLEEGSTVETIEAEEAASSRAETPSSDELEDLASLGSASSVSVSCLED
jgi:hypothetical protein